MIKFKTILSAIVLSGGLVAGAQAAEEGGVHAEQQSWSFAGIFGTYDQHQLQRGFKVFQEVCSSCHSADLLRFRNLAEADGPGYDEEQVKLLASQYTVIDPEAEGGERPGIPADAWPAPFLSEQDARDANNGAFPPDFSVLAKARGIHQQFPYWAFNYFTAYQEGGADYIYNMLVHYTDPPEGVDVPAGQYYNAFLGHAISMPQPLSDGLVSYEGEGEAVPETVEQYSRDVSAFMMWVAEPGLPSRKEMGFRALVFLILLAGLMYLVKRKLWANIKH